MLRTAINSTLRMPVGRQLVDVASPRLHAKVLVVVLSTCVSRQENRSTVVPGGESPVPVEEKQRGVGIVQAGKRAGRRC